MHMMVSEPDKWIDDIAEAGGNNYTFHIETIINDKRPLDKCKKIIEHIKKKGMTAGLAINPGTVIDVNINKSM